MPEGSTLRANYIMAESNMKYTLILANGDRAVCLAPSFRAAIALLSMIQPRARVVAVFRESR